MVKSRRVGWLAIRKYESSSPPFMYSLIDLFVLSYIFIVSVYPPTSSLMFFNFKLTHVTIFFAQMEGHVH